MKIFDKIFGEKSAKENDKIEKVNFSNVEITPNGYLIFGLQSRQKYQMPEAAEYFSKACELKHPEACFILSSMYEYGTGVPENKNIAKELLLKAIKLAKEACEMNDAEACATLGVIYSNDIFSEYYDMDTAIKLLRKACKLGSSRGYYELGMIYKGEAELSDEEYERDGYYQKAKEMLLTSVEKGNAEAAQVLANMYIDGEGVEIDEAKARYFYEKSKHSIRLDPRAFAMLSMALDED